MIPAPYFYSAAREMYFVRRYLQCLKRPCIAAQRITKASCTTAQYSHQVTERELPQYMECVNSMFGIRGYSVCTDHLAI